MDTYTHEELTAAMRAVTSVIHKCETAKAKFTDGNSHHMLLKKQTQGNVYFKNTH